MRKIQVRVGGDCCGRLVYWTYRVYGDIWAKGDECLASCGFRFLKRKDKLGIMCYLIGLESALRHLLGEVEKKGIRVQYLVRFYCIDDNVHRAISKWGYGFRDPMIVEAVNSIRHLVNKIGLLDLVRPLKMDVERELRKAAARYFYNCVEALLEDSYRWELPWNGGYYIVYMVSGESKCIPLEFLAKYALRKESNLGNVKGVIVLKEDGAVTKLFLYDTEGEKSLINDFKNIDPLYKGCRLGKLKLLHFTGLPSDKVEDMLMEVFEKCSNMTSTLLSKTPPSPHEYIRSLNLNQKPTVTLIRSSYAGAARSLRRADPMTNTKIAAGGGMASQVITVKRG